MGRELDRGQITLQLNSAKNGLLLENHYLVECEADVEPVKCDECGSEFIADVWRVGHIERRHLSRVKLPPARQDDESDAEYRIRMERWHEIQDEQEARSIDREMIKMPPFTEKQQPSI
jgi:hypothetical protein